MTPTPIDELARLAGQAIRDRAHDVDRSRPEVERLRRRRDTGRTILASVLVAVVLVAGALGVLQARPGTGPVIGGGDILPSESAEPREGTAEATPSEQQSSFSGPPASCPVTIPQGDFTLPEQYGPVGEGNEWYGSEDLWVRLDQDGDVWLPDDYPHLRRRVVLWSVHQGEPSEEPNPPVRLTAERLDAESPPVSSDEWTTHGWTNSRAGRNLFMFALITLPAPGCWEITAEYRDAALSWVIWAAESQPS